MGPVSPARTGLRIRSALRLVATPSREPCGLVAGELCQPPPTLPVAVSFTSANPVTAHRQHPRRAVATRNRRSTLPPQPIHARGVWLNLLSFLRIKAFFGTSENAVKSQLWIAVSVYVLVAIIKKRLKLSATLHEILRLHAAQPRPAAGTHVSLRWPDSCGHFAGT
jgi:hypothetical protein